MITSLDGKQRYYNNSYCSDSILNKILLLLQSRTRSKLLLKFSAFSYIVPAIIVAIAAGGWPSGYGRSDICWLSTTGDRLIYAFIGPVIAVMVANLFFFFRSVIVVLRVPKRKLSKEHASRFESFKRSLAASGSFFSVMGLGWIFGLLTIENNVLALQYLFAIFGGLQGFLIFYFHVWRDRAMRASLARASNIDDQTSSRSNILRYLFAVFSLLIILLPLAVLRSCQSNKHINYCPYIQPIG